MDVAPAAAEAAVEAGAVVEAACVQQYAAAAAWVRQQAVCVCAAAGCGGRGDDCDGRRAASVRAAVGSGCSVHATVCMRQCAAVAACLRQQAGAASSTIAMGYSDGSGQPVAQLRWAAAARAAAQRIAGQRKNCNEQRLQ
jgi:hypothetical protein